MNLDTLHHSDSASIHPFHKAGTSLDTKEAIIEARIQHIGGEIESLNSDSRLVRLDAGPHVYNSDFDFSVKIEAMRWMLRIAKHMHDSAREAIFLRIQNSLDQLQTTLESAAWSDVT